MVGKEIAVKKYVVRLDAAERDRLNELIRKGRRCRQCLSLKFNGFPGLVRASLSMVS